METEAIILSLGIGLFGILMIIGGLYSLLGPVNAFYIAGYGHLTLLMYILIPGGLFFVLLALAFYLPAEGSLFIINLGLVNIIVGTIIMMRPRLQPQWLQWLKKEHGDILDILGSEIRQERKWNRRIKTQEELQVWVEEVRARRGI